MIIAIKIKAYKVPDGARFAEHAVNARRRGLLRDGTEAETPERFPSERIIRPASDAEAAEFRTARAPPFADRTGTANATGVDGGAAADHINRRQPPQTPKRQGGRPEYGARHLRPRAPALGQMQETMGRHYGVDCEAAPGRKRTGEEGGARSVSGKRQWASIHVRTSAKIQPTASGRFS